MFSALLKVTRFYDYPGNKHLCKGGGGVGTREHWAPRKHQNKPGCSQGNQADAGSVQFSYVSVQLFEYIFFKFTSFILFLPCTKKKAPPSKKKKRFDSVILQFSRTSGTKSNERSEKAVISL